MEARERRRVENAQLLERIRHQICQNFNQGTDKDSCLSSTAKKCSLGLQHICAICACPGHGSHRCRDQIRDDSSPNPDNVIIRHVDPRDPNYARTKAEVFVSSPDDYSAQAAIRRDHKKQTGAGRVFHVLWDHSEQLSARYKQYRQKGRDTKNKEKKDIWPDDIEEAFQIGLRCYARRGRKKEELHGKQCGGNEFISDWIWAATSVWRDRKQVSSHIQVLKGYMMHNPRWLDLLKGDPRWKKLPQAMPGLQPPSPPNAEHMSAFGTATSHSIYGQQQTLPPIDVLPSNLPHGPTIRSVKFDMTRCFVPPPANGYDSALSPRIHHRYTSIQSEMGSSPQPLESLAHWRTKFPHFTPQDSHGNATPIFLFASSLALIEDDPKEKTSISVTFEVDFAQAANYRDWIQRTYVSDLTGYTDFLEKELIPANACGHPDSSDEARSSGEKSLTLPLHFRASYWAQTISVMLGRRQAASHAGLAELRRDEEYSRRFVNSISLMQELWAHPATPGAPIQRMAVLLWRFQQTHGKETPTTTWRRLTAPNQQVPNSSLMRNNLPQVQPAVAMSMNEGFNGSLSQQDSISYGNMRNLNNSTLDGNINLDNTQTHPLLIPGHASPGSVPPLDDDQSFPSATTASFPSTISNPQYHTLPSNGSGNGNGNGYGPCVDYARPSPYSSQPSPYPVDDQGPVYVPLDLPPPELNQLPYAGDRIVYNGRHCSQPYQQDLPAYSNYDAHMAPHSINNLLLPEDRAPSYGRPPIESSFESQPRPGGMTTESKSTGDQVDQASGPDSEAPLIAPRAHMISQHQILQLDQFDPSSSIRANPQAAMEHQMSHAQHPQQPHPVSQIPGLRDQLGSISDDNGQSLPSRQMPPAPPPSTVSSIHHPGTGFHSPALPPPPGSSQSSLPTESSLHPWHMPQSSTWQSGVLPHKQGPSPSGNTSHDSNNPNGYDQWYDESARKQAPYIDHGSLERRFRPLPIYTSPNVHHPPGLQAAPSVSASPRVQEIA